MKRRARVGDIANTVLLTPDVVRAEIRKTRDYTNALQGEFSAAYEAELNAGASDAHTTFFIEWSTWKRTFDEWAEANLNDPWWPTQVVGMKAINNQNNKYREEAIGYQKRARSLGWKTDATPPEKAPGLGKGEKGGLGSFLSGMGAGTIAALAIAAVVLLSGKDRR